MESSNVRLHPWPWEVADDKPQVRLKPADWGLPPLQAEEGVPLTLPAQAVLFTYTETDTCEDREQCREALLRLRDQYREKGLYELPWNFVIGGDGTVFEARGWMKQPEPHPEFPEWTGKSIEIAHFGSKGVPPNHDQMVASWTIVNDGTNATPYLVAPLPVRRTVFYEFGRKLNETKNKATKKEEKELEEEKLLTLPQTVDSELVEETGTVDADRVEERKFRWVPEIRRRQLTVVPRQEWGGPPLLECEFYELPFLPHPIGHVILTYTGSDYCHSPDECREAMSRLHEEAVAKGMWTVPFNFVVGGDGTVYEARGWKRKPERNKLYPELWGESIEVAHFGRKGSPPPINQIAGSWLLFLYGISMKYFDKKSIPNRLHDFI